MKAIVWTRYGSADGLELHEIAKPIPRANEIRVKVHATTVTAGDCEMRSLQFSMVLALSMRLYTGLRKPERVKIIGQEFSGVVEAVGEAVTRFKVGDMIFGTTGFGQGTYAEYICLPEVPDDMDGVYTTMPNNMTFEEAGAVATGGLESLRFLSQAHIQRGQSVLINGAGGSIGTFGLQLAKYLGAHVTAVDHGDKLAMLRELGADEVIDYTREDFTQAGRTYDVIFDVVGKASFMDCLSILKPNGYYLIANPTFLRFVQSKVASWLSDKTVMVSVNSAQVDDLHYLRELIEDGHLKTVIDRTYGLENMVEAHRYVEAGYKRGNIIIQVDGVSRV